MDLRMPRTAMTVLLTVLTLLASACGGTSEQAAAPEAPSTPAPTEDAGRPTAAATVASDYNAADIAFLQEMIPHHQGAIEMAELVPERTDRPELNYLANDIVATQQAEVDEMQAMLEEAGRSAGGHGSGHDDMAAMGTEDMTSLEQVEGPAFDLLFIDMMIAHHNAAIASATDVLKEGANPKVRTLAEEVVSAQEAEVEQMTAWREEWSGESA